jgi:translation initiation factor IF-3
LWKAFDIARERNLDIVEVAPDVRPPVCRLLDYGKFKYEQSKKEREARKRQKTVEVSQIRLRPSIGKHDLDAKIRTAKKLFEEGCKVKFSVFFRGREIDHIHLGRKLMEEVLKALEGVAVQERAPMMEGRSMSMILSPDKSEIEKGKGN